MKILGDAGIVFKEIWGKVPVFSKAMFIFSTIGGLVTLILVMAALVKYIFT